VRVGGVVKKVVFVKAVAVATAVLLFPHAGAAQEATAQTLLAPAGLSQSASDQQSNVPVAAQRAQGDVERAVNRFRIGVEGGVGLDPEIIIVGAHGSFAPVFSPRIAFRPGVEFGFGEVTTLFGINLDVLYTLPGSDARTQWTPYVGAGPNFALSHRGFEADATADRNRFDFGDTDFNSGFNFIAGARARNGTFLELKATAYGVSNVRLLVGYNF